VYTNTIKLKIHINLNKNLKKTTNIMTSSGFNIAIMALSRVVTKTINTLWFQGFYHIWTILVRNTRNCSCIFKLEKKNCYKDMIKYCVQDKTREIDNGAKKMVYMSSIPSKQLQHKIGKEIWSKHKQT
jgi:hypothetical protein